MINIIELEKEIKETKQKLHTLEAQLESYPRFTLMHRVSKGKHTFVLQPRKQVVNLKLNGWKEIDVNNLMSFIKQVIN